MQQITAQEHLERSLENIFRIHKSSDGLIRPHFFLTGASGTGKTHTIQKLAEEWDMPFIEINAATLTKEGTAGSSLTKAMVPLAAYQNTPSICFVDEFDKLFLAGNSNSDTAHEITVGVQNEFLKVVESDRAPVFGEYGKYPIINIGKVLFIFAGAFNGEENIDQNRLLEMGVKTEFLGRVNLVYETKPVELDDLLLILENSELLAHYFDLYELDESEEEKALIVLREAVTKTYEGNQFGIRLINGLIHRYFIQDCVLDIEILKPEKKTKKLKLFNNKK